MTRQRAEHPFRFVTRANITELTGLAAGNLQELIQILKTAPAAITYYHTHNFLKQHHYLSPEPPNDFAYWVQTSLKEERLAEQLASIDTIQFDSLRSLRDRIVQVLEKHLSKTGSSRQAPEHEEFHFMKSLSVILPTPYQANDLTEFADAVRNVSIHSLYHHMFESRLRLEKGMNDFSIWLEHELDEKPLARAIARLDPYTQTLESLRHRIVRLTGLTLPQPEPEELHAS